MKDWKKKNILKAKLEVKENRVPDLFALVIYKNLQNETTSYLNPKIVS